MNSDPGYAVDKVFDDAQERLAEMEQPTDATGAASNEQSADLDMDEQALRLAERLQETGDPHLLNQLVERYYEPLLGYATRLQRRTSGVGLAHALSPEDAVHTVIENVYKRLGRLKQTGEALPLLHLSYFVRSVQRYYLDYYKSPRAQTDPVGEMSEGIVGSYSIDPAHFAIRSVASECLREMLADISEVAPPKDLQIAYDVWLGMSRQAAARKHGIAVGTVNAAMGRVGRKINPIVQEKRWLREVYYQ